MAFRKISKKEIKIDDEIIDIWNVNGFLWGENQFADLNTILSTDTRIISPRWLQMRLRE